MRMRTMLLLPLLLIPILLTSVSLLVLQQQMQNQMRTSVSADLSHSAATYRNLEQQRREALRREALLLSYQPSLRALMTTGDAHTIQDEGGEYAKLSGADLLALLTPSHKVVAAYGENATVASDRLAVLLNDRKNGVVSSRSGFYIFDGEHLFEVAVQPIYFGSAEAGSLLGYVAIGSRIDDAVARQVSQTAGSEIAFAVGSKVAGSTLETDGRRRLSILLRGSPDPIRTSLARANESHDPLTLDLDGAHFLVDRIALDSDEREPILLIALRSMEDFRRTQERLNRIVLAIGSIAAIAGVFLAYFVARRLTSPLEVLAERVAAVGRGNYETRLPVSGASEIRALSGSIETMNAKIRETQAKLMAAERLATIGQMASSVSHDLRHYLASVYANAEFLAAEVLSSEERADLLAEIQMSVQGTTDLIDSLLLFTQTGRVLHISCESVAYLAERAIHRASRHPEASGVSIQFDSAETGDAWVDAKKIERAIYNLVLNGCQAAKLGPLPQWVRVTIHEEGRLIYFEVRDSGPGVSPDIRSRLFDPFVSANRENGIGIGLTLAATIAQEHGGNISLECSGGRGDEDATTFLFTLNRDASRTSVET
jgi:signal transduction histidine kinase